MCWNMRTMLPHLTNPFSERFVMPFIDVKLFEERLTPEIEQDLIAQLTEAVVHVLGEQARDVTWVVLEGTPAQRWGVGGKLGETK